MKNIWSRIWPLLLFAVCLTGLVRFIYWDEAAHPEYVGWCEQFSSGDEHYWQQENAKHLTCAEMHEIPSINDDKPQNGTGSWWYVYIVGTKQEGVFAKREDAINWADEQKLVFDPKQVR